MERRGTVTRAPANVSSVSDESSAATTRPVTSDPSLRCSATTATVSTGGAAGCCAATGDTTATNASRTEKTRMTTRSRRGPPPVKAALRQLTSFHDPSDDPRRAEANGVGESRAPPAYRQGRDAREPDLFARERLGAVSRHRRVRRDGPAAARERHSVPPQLHSARPARSGEKPDPAPAGDAAR